ncbi:FadR/GntR family transcriptional regulator [Pedobacter duraquae]|uniref:GntR family transcriptional regulator n=1 Tax=Pedobacter duraquae TaxID=425511 RepID=A0A4V3C357_9SPHI|nr:FCD domain-containing protein [Pedobacter duraquae]TDO20789.1 GntR family transcriptional regulator [Pedobacter duraquae]
METQLRLFEQIALRIRDDIKEARFKAGEKLPPEPLLMECYSVGRSTIREAIKSLTLSGILTVRQGFGTMVNDVSAEPIEHRLRRSDFGEINQVRSILEKEIVSLAVKHRTTENLESISAALKKRREAIEQESKVACANADIEFHMAIARASGNQVLADLYGSFTVVIRDFFSRREPSGVTHFAMSHYLHQSLFDSIEAKDEERATHILSQILNNNH